MYNAQALNILFLQSRTPFLNKAIIVQDVEITYEMLQGYLSIFTLSITLASVCTLFNYASIYINANCLDSEKIFNTFAMSELYSM